MNTSQERFQWEIVNCAMNPRKSPILISVLLEAMVGTQPNSRRVGLTPPPCTCRLSSPFPSPASEGLYPTATQSTKASSLEILGTLEALSTGAPSQDHLYHV